MISGLYIHIPFCAKRCHYCDFNTYEGMDHLKADYARLLIDDLALAVPARQAEPLTSIFFGGGTPSLMSAEQIGALIEAARGRFEFRPDIEITLEANPGTAEAGRFRAYREAGVNRISMGMQAAQQGHLESLGRIHTAAESEAAWKAGREAGFDNMSLDLMFGLPGQTPGEWDASLDWALAFKPEHLSFYGLTIEPGTRFHHLHSQGQLPLPDDEVQATMYETGIATLAKAGLRQYEISNFARSGRQSRHNRLYWLNRPTLGIGAGAWSFVGGERFSREKNPSKYMEAISEGRVPVKDLEKLEGRQARGEAAYLGLRLMEGLDLDLWKAEYQVDFIEEFGTELAPLQEQGLVILAGNRLCLTSKGLPLANQVFGAFL